MAIEYPTSKTADAAIKCALSHPDYLSGQSWLITWEHEMAVERFKKHGPAHDTCFDHLITRFIREWTAKHGLPYLVIMVPK